MSATQTVPLDVAEVRALLVRAVAEKGADYVYVNPDGMRAGIDGEVQCRNWTEGGAPSCIAGHVFSYMGLTPEDVPADDSVMCLVDGVIAAEARGPLQAAQFAQDDGKTWGDALAAFDAEVSA